MSFVTMPKFMLPAEAEALRASQAQASRTRDLGAAHGARGAHGAGDVGGTQGAGAAGGEQTFAQAIASAGTSVGNSAERGSAEVASQRAASNESSSAEAARASNDYGTPGDGYTTAEFAFETGPSSLDPGSMAFLLAFLGGSPDHKSLVTQQQEYLDYYRTQYASQATAPAQRTYITATTNYTTGKA